jgi:hypothetical protein
MPARFRISTPAATRAPAHPARQHRLALDVGVLASASAVRVGSVMSWGVRITSIRRCPDPDAAIASACS